MVAGAIAYANSLHGPLIFDDHRTLRTNESIRQLATSLNPPAQTAVAGRPVANLTFALNYAISDLDVTSYHVVNVALHLVAALTLFGLLRRTFASEPAFSNSRDWAAGGPADGPTFGALTCALVWALHPLNTEAVDYLTQRTELLAGLLFLLTLYSAARAGTTDASGVKPGSRAPWSAIAVGACACGMASKESMAIAPVMVAVYDRVFLYASFREAFRRRIRLYAGLAATWLVFALLARGTPFFSPSGFDRQISWRSYLVNQAPMVARYLRLSVWPRGLVLDYGLPQSLSVADVWASAGLVLALMILTLVALWRTPRWGFWGLWFFLTLAPSSGVVPIPTEVGAERRMYVPLVAVIVLFVLSVAGLLHAFVSRWHRPLRRPVVPVALLAIVTALGIATWQRNTEYQSEIGLWETVLDRRAHPRAHLNLAAELRAAGRHDDAIAELRMAVPDLPDARRVLAFELIGKGEVQEAVAQLSEFVRLKPNDPEISEARETLAEALASQGDLVGSRQQLDLLTAAAPDYATGHLKLADTLVTLRDLDGAVAQYQMVLRLQPSNAHAFAHLGLVLAQKSDATAAARALGRALELQPEYDDARRDLIGILLGERLYAQAEKESRALLARQPGDAEAHNRLGVALAAVGRTPDALAEFREAVRLNPNAAEARNNLARATGAKD